MPNLDSNFYLDRQGVRTLINELETNVIAEEFSSSATYTLGSYCIYENNLYRCISPVTTAGSWTGNTNWLQILVTQDIKAKTTIQSITLAQWETLTPEEKAANDYVITDAPRTVLSASNVPYDNTQSGISPDNVQSAIDYLVEHSQSSYQTKIDSNLQTTATTVVGAINEHQSVIGYSYDAYDATTAYSKDDLCIYNNVLYKAKQATTGNLPTNTTYWDQTSIADEINKLKANNDITVAYNKTSFVNGYVKRNDNVVCISLVLLVTENIANNDEIVSGLPLPDSSYNLRVLLPTGTSQWQPTDFISQCGSIITSGGIGVIGSIATGKYIFIDATYICK